MVERVGLVEAAALALPDLLGEFEHDGRTGGRFTREIDRFVERAVLDGVEFIDEVTPGVVAGFCGEAVCIQHDGTPFTADEADQFEAGDDPCLPMVRVFPDA